MIFSCPECEKKYILSASALGEDGKTVRCANCAYEWFQEPEQLPYQESESQDAEDYYDDDHEEESDDFTYEDDLLEENSDDGDSDNDVPANRLDDFFDDEEEENYNSFQDDDEEQPLEDLIKELSLKNQTKNENDELVDKIDLGEEMPIPKGVKPIKDEMRPPQKEPKAKRENIEEPIMARLTGMVAALFVFALLFIAAILVKPQIVSAWPPAAAIYELAGLPMTVEGEGLVIESLFATMSKDNSQLNLKGTIINLKSKPIKIPPMKASFKITDQGSNVWIIDAPQPEIAGNDSIEFNATYDSPPEDVSMLNVTFSSTLK